MAIHVLENFITPQEIGGLIGFVLPTIVLLFFAKYRGIWASLLFLPVVFIVMSFTISKIPAAASFAETNTIFGSFLSSFNLLLSPFWLVHGLIFKALALIGPGENLWQDTILVSDWFPMVLYIVLWIIMLIIFRPKNKRKQRRYEDDF